MCAMIMPGKLEDRPTSDKKKNNAEPDIIKGTIIGDIKTPIISPLYGINRLLKPKAAKVPNAVAPNVAKKAIIILFLKAKPHGFFVP